VIEVSRIQFLWPTVEGTWDEIRDTPALAYLFVWKGTIQGAIAVRLFITIAVLTFVPALLLPRPKLSRTYTGRRAFTLRWMLWVVYIGPKPPTVVIRPDPFGPPGPPFRVPDETGCGFCGVHPRGACPAKCACHNYEGEAS